MGMNFCKNFRKSEVDKQKQEALAKIYQRVGVVYKQESSKYIRGHATRQDVAAVLLAEGHPKWMVEEAVDYIFQF